MTVARRMTERELIEVHTVRSPDSRYPRFDDPWPQQGTEAYEVLKRDRYDFWVALDEYPRWCARPTDPDA